MGAFSHDWIWRHAATVCIDRHQRGDAKDADLDQFTIELICLSFAFRLSFFLCPIQYLYCAPTDNTLSCRSLPCSVIRLHSSLYFSPFIFFPASQALSLNS